MIRVKRVYDAPSVDDGMRILVDRLWPRGLTRDVAAIDKWVKDIAPSHDLRKWFNHEPSRWPEFQVRYRLELQSHEATAILDELRSIASKDSITLVYAATERRLNNAVVLSEILSRQSHHPE
ncbi:MAG: DUF488 family protein [Hyphomicrobiaceae bacterium]|nr:DUF488 family protein [Hyphomicrobiaceae bacterium]